MLRQTPMASSAEKPQTRLLQLTDRFWDALTQKEKVPSRGSGLSVQRMLSVSVACDHRSTEIELVAQPAHDLESLELERLAGRREGERARARCHCARCKDRRDRPAIEGGRAVVAVAAFEADDPVVGDRVFETAADRPADEGLLVSGEGRRERNAARRRGDEVGADLRIDERRAAGGVDHPAIPGVAEAAAGRSLPVAAEIKEVARDERERQGGGAECAAKAQALPIRVAFQAEDPVARLDVTAELSARDQARALGPPEGHEAAGANAGRRHSHRTVALRPLAAHVAADIAAGPAKGRSHHGGYHGRLHR